ncbi:MAG: hypothetical protein V5A43_09265 [Haloarculaceae archaeon]
MQRRAAAVYFALFVLIGAGTLGFIQVGTSQPEVRLQAGELSSGDALTVEGVDYTVSDIGFGETEGEGEGEDIVGTLSWTNESYVATATLDNGSTIPFEGEEYRVVIENRTDVSSFELVEAFNVTALLLADDDVENELATRNGTDHVVYRADQRIEPLSEWLPAPDRQGPFAVGETMPYAAEEGTVPAAVRSVEPDAATLAWDSTDDREAELTEGGNVTLGETQYFAHFTDEEHVQLVPTDQYWAAYQEELAYEDAWFERHAGLWAVVIASFLAAVILLSTAYMPVKS